MRGPRINRITPAVGAEHYQTYSITRPDTRDYWVPATCEQIDCAPHLHGWTTRVDETTDLGQAQAHYIRRQSGRRFTEQRRPDGTTEFTFEAGQACFAQGEHRRAIEREPLYVVRGGDWRGNPRCTPARVHRDARDWVDDCGEHLDTLAERRARG